MMDSYIHENGLELSRLGLGCMRMSMVPDTNRSESIAVIHSALDTGIKLINTGDFYGKDGHNELLIGEALTGRRREQAFISLKYGTFGSPQNPSNYIDVGPKNVKTYLARSLSRLGLDYVDLYQPARIDTGIPVEDTIGAIAELVQEGLVKHIGLSEVDPVTLRQANSTFPISLVEFAYSILDDSIESDILPLARELKIPVVAFGLMGLGKLTKNPNDPLIKHLQKLANEKRVTLSQLAHAWILYKGNDIIPLVGAKTMGHFSDSVQCIDLEFTPEEIRSIEEARKLSSLVGRWMPKMVIKNGVMT